MKYVIVLGDGMSDRPLPELDMKTPLQCANKPNIDYMANNGEIGLVKTVPENISPGSDVANLSVLGYDPVKYYTGRSSLEAAGLGINLKDSDVALRCNLVTLSEKEEKYSEKVIIDHSSDEISTEEAWELINDLSYVIKPNNISFYKGTSYRHCTIWANGNIGLNLTPPHDILGQKIGNYLPKGDKSKILLEIMEQSYNVLNNHYINVERKKKGLRPANSVWFWGEGKKAIIPNFKEKYGIEGSVITAVDLIKGIAVCAGLNIVEVEGATGNIHTNFEGKALAAINELKNGKDFVFIHIEAPDECSHRYEIENKIKSIEYIDNKVVEVLLNQLPIFGDFRILIMPDHPTLLSTRTHASDPVPYVIYGKGFTNSHSASSYNEIEAQKTGIFHSQGYHFIDYFFNI